MHRPVDDDVSPVQVVVKETQMVCVSHLLRELFEKSSACCVNPRTRTVGTVCLEKLIEHEGVGNRHGDDERTAEAADGITVLPTRHPLWATDAWKRKRVITLRFASCFGGPSQKSQ